MKDEVMDMDGNPGFVLPSYMKLWPKFKGIFIHEEREGHEGRGVWGRGGCARVWSVILVAGGSDRYTRTA
jgi:hypothetical protein